MSGLAAAFPEITAALVHERSAAAHDRSCRRASDSPGIPFHATLKEVLAARDVLAVTDVRPPLRGLDDDERAAVLALASELGVLA